MWTKLGLFRWSVYVLIKDKHDWQPTIREGLPKGTTFGFVWIRVGIKIGYTYVRETTEAYCK